MIKPQLSKFVKTCLLVIEKEQSKDNEECFLNIVSCLTNLLFYDLPKMPVFPKETVDESRLEILKSVNRFVVSENIEMQVESMRVLCNLSRN